MLRAQCVGQILGVNILLSLGNTHIQIHKDGFSRDNPWRSSRMNDHFNGHMEERGPLTVVTGDKHAHRGL